MVKYEDLYINEALIEFNGRDHRLFVSSTDPRLATAAKKLLNRISAVSHVNLDDLLVSIAEQLSDSDCQFKDMDTEKEVTDNEPSDPTNSTEESQAPE